MTVKRSKSNSARPEPASILMVSDDAEFSATVKARWLMEREVPGFTLIGSALVRKRAATQCQVVIVGPVQEKNLEPVLALLAQDARPVIVVAPDSESAARAFRSTPLVVRQHDGWLDSLVVLTGEALRRVGTVSNRGPAGAGPESNSLEKEAALGRFMLEMKHSCNNAMTSIVGNSELLLMEPGALSAEVREQIETIHSMSLRLYEVWQRFSALQTELEIPWKSSHHETEQSIQAEVSSRR